MPREEHGHGLVAQLLAGHPLAGLCILGFHEHGEEVAAVAAVLPPLRDDVGDEAVEDAHRPVEPDVRGRGQGREEEQLLEPRVRDLERRAEGRGDVARR